MGKSFGARFASLAAIGVLATGALAAAAATTAAPPPTAVKAAEAAVRRPARSA